MDGDAFRWRRVTQVKREEKVPPTRATTSRSLPLAFPYMKLLSRRAVLSTAAAAAVFSSPHSAAIAMPVPSTAEELRALTLRSGTKMPLIGLGTWESAPGEVGAAVEAALASGGRHIDCAAAYRNEQEVRRLPGPLPLWICVMTSFPFFSMLQGLNN